jgi:hypothetical protein
MEDIKIKLLLKATDGAVLFIEFIQDGRTKILSYDNFIARFGIEALSKI